MATYIEMTAPGGFAPYDQAHVTWEKDGSVTLRTASHNHGQGHETTFAQIVSRVLGIPVESIRLRTSEPEHNFVANPTGGSRTLHGLGSAMHWASQEIAKNGLDLAAEHLESAVQDIEFDLGTYRIKGTDRKVRIEELAKKYPGRLDLDFKDRPKVPATFPNGCHVAEVEIDPETGAVRHRVLRRLRRRRQHHQPPDRRRADAGRRHSGRGAHLPRAGRLRRLRPAPDRQLHGLRHAARRAGRRAHRDRPCRADRDQPARRQGRRRGRRHRLACRR